MTGFRFKGRDRVPGFIFSAGGSAAGFLQCERQTPGHEFWKYAAADGETWAVDLLIGGEALVGRGLGPRVIAAFLARLADRPPGWQRILIDPEVRHVRAVRAHGKGWLPAGSRSGRPAADGPGPGHSPQTFEKNLTAHLGAVTLTSDKGSGMMGMELLLAGLTILGSLVLASVQHRPRQARVSLRTSRKD